MAEIYLLKASCDLSIAAQYHNSSEADVKLFNKQLKWQINNRQKGVQFIPTKHAISKFLVFVDELFANSNYFSSHIGFVLALANESERSLECYIRGDTVYWSSVKCQQVIYSVLDSKLYAMVQ